MVKLLRCLQTLFKAMRTYVTSVAVCAGLFALLITTPWWPSAVTLEPLNPMFVVNGNRLSELIQQAVAAGWIQSNTVAKLNTSLSLNFPHEGNTLVFFREWYSKVQSPASGPLARGPAPVATDEDPNVAWGLKFWKESLGINDKETAKRMSGRPIYRYENFLTKEELRASSNNLCLLLRILDAAASQPLFGSSERHFGPDPFYRVIENVDSTTERVHLFKVLCEASQTFSWFVVYNNSSGDVYDLRVTADMGRYGGADIKQTVLDAYNITPEKQGSGSVILKINNLTPGPMNYKLVLIKTNGKPVKVEDVRLGKPNVIERTGEYWKWWLVIIPLVLLIVESLVRHLIKRDSLNARV